MLSDSRLSAVPTSVAASEPVDWQLAVKTIFGDKFCRPLFVVGSGISQPQGAPSMTAVFAYLKDRIQAQVDASSKPDTEVTAVQAETLRETSQLARALAEGIAHRPLAAR